MSRKRLYCALLVMVACGPETLQAQIGEVQIGPVMNYGSAKAFGPGFGAVFGVAAGRVGYIGARYTYQRGASTPTTSDDVMNRVQVFGMDLGFLIPVGNVEIVPGATIGGVRFTQRVQPLNSERPQLPDETAGELTIAPSLSAELHLSRVVWIPELQYYLTGQPELPRAVSHRGFVMALRIVVPIETGRIRQ
jgi:hypothetical protein